MSRWSELLADGARDVFTSLNSRSGRTLLLVASVALSAGALVASVSIGQTAAAQISTDLAATIRNAVTVTGAPTAGADPAGTDLFPSDAEARAKALPMVEAAGMRLDVEATRSAVRRFSESKPVSGLQVIGVTSGYLEAVRVGLPPGAWALDAKPSQPVVLLGKNAAARLGVPGARESTSYSILVGGREFQVLGTAQSPERILDDDVLVPYQVAVDLMGGDSASRLVVRTATGAGARVADAIRFALRPDEPSRLQATRVADLSGVRRGVESQLGRLLAAVGALLLIISGLLIANSMVASVVSRTSEIGLRRALGSSRRAVMSHFLAEGAAIGVFGGLGGAALGGWGAVLVAAINHWSAVLAPGALLIGVALGFATGIGAAAYPAIRAARTSPAEALRVE